MKKPGEEYLRPNDFTAPGRPDIHVALGHGDAQAKDDLDSVDLGPLKANQGDQNYDVPAGTARGIRLREARNPHQQAA